MRFTTLVAPATLIAALAFTIPASADQRGHDRGGRGGHDGGGRSESSGRRDGGNRDNGSRGESRRDDGNRGYAVARAPRGDYGRDYRRDGDYGRRDVYVNRGVPRSVYVAPRGRSVYVAPYRGYGSYGGYARPYYRTPYVYRPYVYYPGRGYYGGYGHSYYYRPYSFRPRFSLSLGFFSGYPVPYSWGYPAYAPSYDYSPGYNVVPGPTTYGGLSFDVNPADATVYVDGNFAGTTTQFNGSQQPLSLSAGRHRIELRASGCEPLEFTVDIQPGQVIPYQGDLLPIH